MHPILASSNALKILAGTAELIVFLCAIGWVIVRWIKKSDEPLSLIVKLAVSVPILAGVVGLAVTARDPSTMIMAVMVGAVGGLFLAMIWAGDFCAWVASPFENLYTGGNQSFEARALYSMAYGKRKRGLHQEAIAEIQRQLEKFPGDFEGEMLLADIYAVDLQQFSQAEEVILTTIHHEKRSPQNIAYALNRLADWHLKFHQDRDAARAVLEKILELLPDSEQAQMASQRIAHLTPAEMLAEQKERTPLALPHHEEHLGLLGKMADPRPVEDPGKKAQEFIKHLEQFPNDNDAREQLAIIYLEHYKRIDLAIDQLEQLIATPGQAAKAVVHWLNTIADWHIKWNGDLAAAKLTLLRIGERYPDSAAAANAQKRISFLRMETRPQQHVSTLKLGSYDQNIGLKPKG
jgi:tetratricopeptide (TPR) repeat protein